MPIKCSTRFIQGFHKYSTNIPLGLLLYLINLKNTNFLYVWNFLLDIQGKSFKETVNDMNIKLTNLENFLANAMKVNE